MTGRSRSRARGALWVAAAAATAAAGMAIMTSPTDASPPSSSAPAGAASSAQQLTENAATALDELMQLTVASADDATTYSREAFGQAWADTDRNGCDQRNDALQRGLENVTTKPGTHGCVVLTGTLHDPYTGMTIDFQRGAGTSELVQIDHIVPLAWAWRQGASRWDDSEREAFANDAHELLAVDGAANQAKSDSGPAEWMPPNTAFACSYAELFVAVLTDYQLSVDASDRSALQTVLTSCTTPEATATR